jgi:hypothetical protein
MLQSRSFGLIVAGLLLVVISSRAEAGPQDKNPSVKIQVDSILATYSPDIASGPNGAPTVKMDHKLTEAGIADRLLLMFDYNNYQLKVAQNENSNFGEAVAFNLPGGHILHIAPLAIIHDELAMQLAMFEGDRMIMQMPMKMISGGMLLLVDEHRPNQFYITAISADCPLLPHVAHIKTTPPPGAPVQAFPALVPAQ